MDIRAVQLWVVGIAIRHSIPFEPSCMRSTGMVAQEISVSLAKAGRAVNALGCTLGGVGGGGGDNSTVLA